MPPTFKNEPVTNDVRQPEDVGAYLSETAIHERPSETKVNKPTSVKSRHLGLYFATAAVRRAGQWLPPIVALLSLVVVWELVCRLMGVKEYLLPAPTRVASVMYSKLDLLVFDSLITLVEAAMGFGLAFFLAFTISLTFTYFRLLERALMPYLVAFQAVPIIAIAPLLVLWSGNGLLGKVIMAAIICFFPAVVSITRGLRSVNPDALTLMHSLSASPLQILFKLRVPSSLPFVFAAMRISATLSVIGALVAEISGAKRGIGFRIVISSYRTDTTLLFAALMFSIVLGLVFYGTMVLIEAVIRRYRPVGHNL